METVPLFALSANANGSTAIAKRPRILVAEDESVIALELEVQLQDLGYAVVGPVARIDRILEMARAGRIDGALLDVNLRGKQIFEILPELLALSVPVIITSGYDDATLYPAQFRDLPRIPKPFDKVTLRKVCTSVFGEPIPAG